MTNQASTIRLLLVDDEVEFLDSTRKALSRRGFTVKTAANGNIALSILQKESFDVAVLDVKMPGIPGDELFKEIQQRHPDMPMVMLTGHGNVQQAFQTSREGIFDYLTKPCQIDVLVQIIREAVESKRKRSSIKNRYDETEKIRLLIVDDEREMQEEVAPVLSRYGMQITIAPTTAEALDLISRQLFDVAVMNVKTPLRDGIILLDMIRQRLPFCETVLFTDQPSVDIAIRDIDDGPFEYIAKPRSAQTLTGVIRLAFNRSRLRLAEARGEHIDDNPVQH